MNPLHQLGGWEGEKALQQSDLTALLRKKFAEVDFEAAKKDVLPFLKDAAAIALWSREFFESLLSRLKIV
ncbi:MAG: hypothetical protein AABZ06_05690 [Bdellovibrionota bacterium]